MSIEWYDLLWVVAVGVAVIGAVYLLGWLSRRHARQQVAAIVEKQETFETLQSWLLQKMAADLVEADSGTTPYINAFIELTHQSDTVDELRPIVEVYRHRSGFNNEWIGE